MVPATSGYSSQAASLGAGAFHAQTAGLISRSVPAQLQVIAQDVTHAVCATCCTFVHVGSLRECHMVQQTLHDSLTCNLLSRIQAFQLFKLKV